MTSPNSSQSFWAEALALEGGPTKDRPRQTTDPPETPHKLKRPVEGSSISPAVAKRARFILSPDSDETPPRQREKGEPSSPSSPINVTETSFLPSRLGGLAVTPHAYLQGAEYAPNAFGDIGDYMRKKEIKIQTQHAQIASEGTDKPQIFAGLSFYINGNTTPPMEVLRRMLLQHGGIVQYKLKNKGSVDYIIAPVLTLKKFKDLEKGGRLRIVREQWVVQSVKEGRILDWKNYRLRVEGVGGAMEGFLRNPTQTDGTATHAEERIQSEHPADEPSGPEEPADEAPNIPTRPMTPITSTLMAAPQSLLRSVRTSQRPQPRPLPATDAEPAPDTAKPMSVAAPDSLLRKPTVFTTPTTTIAEIQRSGNCEDEGDQGPVDSSTLPPASPTEPAQDPAAVAPPARPEGAFEKYYPYDTNRDASRMMQNEEFRSNRTSESGATFINEFYQNSRLHYLSTWKAQLRLIVAEARSAANRVPAVLPPDGASRVIFHVDFDAFFVSAGLATRPHLKGKMVVVCHSAKGGKDSTSEIASASYEARAKGVRNGMSLGRARQLCGDGLTPIPYEFETYKKFSLLFYTVLDAYADELEAVSVDEALLDVTGVVTARRLAPPEAGLEDEDPAVQVANKIRDDIRAGTGCEVSIGISHNVLLAKLATRKAKPGGVFHLSAEGAPEFLADLDVESLPGVGYSMRRKLDDAFGTTTCGPLLAQTRDNLRKALGPKTGDTLYGYLRGHDDRRIEPDKERKSVSAEINYAIRFRAQEGADAYLLDLANEVAKRLSAIGARGRHVTLKIMSRHPDAPEEPPKFMGHGKCETFNKSVLLPRHTDEGGFIGRECVKLLHSMRLDPTELRGLGIQVTKLEFGGPTHGVKGQTMLSFARTADNAQEKTPDVEVDPDPEEHMLEEEQKKEPGSPSTETGSPSPPDAPSSDALIPPLAAQPSSDRIDPDFLAALPPELRNEVVADHQAERARRHASREASAPAPPQAAPALRSERNPAAHITKQLRPKNKTHLRADEIAELPLYNAWARADDNRSRSNSIAPKSPPRSESPIGGFAPSELRELGIDAEVFAALPPEVQQESVAAQRARRARTVTHKHASPRKRPDIPAPVANNNSRPALFGAVETADVSQVLRQWVGSREVPAERDVKKVLGYLCKCVVSGLGGIEHVTALLRGMRTVVGDSEEWKGAWVMLSEGVDGVVRERMGAGLRL